MLLLKYQLGLHSCLVRYTTLNGPYNMCLVIVLSYLKEANSSSSEDAFTRLCTSVHGRM